ncbi:MAG: hypothetical protein ACLFUE_05695 [Desulfobacteraceae bacterium]
MGAFSDYLEDAILDHVLNNGRALSYTPPSTLYLALFTSENGLEDNEEGSQDEVSGGGYARESLDGATNYFEPSSDGTTENHDDIEWPTATADWGTITHVAIMDAETSGNVLIWGELTRSKLIEEGDQFKFTAGNLEISLD